MKNPITLFMGLLIGSIAFSQAPPLPPTVCKEFRPAGWIYFHDASIGTGELFTTYKYCFFTEMDNEMVVVDTWTDEWLGLNHFRHQQEYLGVEVEGCEFITHAGSDNKLIYANGKICQDIHTKYLDKPISEEVAFMNLVEHYGSTVWSWQSPEFEDQWKLDLDDPMATSLPTGELVFTTNSWQVPIGYQMDANDFRMAWRFDVISLDPDFRYTVWVDAMTGNVFKELTNRIHDGPADIAHHGTQTIDTSPNGSDFRLRTDNGTVDVHTKYDGFFSWGLTSEIEDDDDNWGADEPEGTAPHWGVTQTWLYFQNTHSRDGLDDNGGKVRVFASTTDAPGAWYDQLGIGTTLGLDRLYAGYYGDGVYTGEISVMAHEFTHGVDHREGKLFATNESGALDESFADIFGFLVRRFATGSESWEIGVPTTLPRNRRNLQFPKTIGIHYDITYSGGVPTSVSEAPGQPDTYEGEFWHPYMDEGTDLGGVHTNSGVQNHWFFILSWGEVGTNDHGDAYSVSGIGIDKAAEITYYNLTSNMSKYSVYEDAMEGAIAAAMLFYGECSFEHIETQNAWYAVGVGTESTCVGAGIEEPELRFELYPNPSSDMMYIALNKEDNYSVKIYSSTGELVIEIPEEYSNYFQIDVSQLANGTYILTVNGQEVERARFVKN